MNKLTLEAMQNILSEVKKGDFERVAFKSGQLRQFFPRDWTVDQMKQEILRILNEHMEQEYKNHDVNGGKGQVYVTNSGEGEGLLFYGSTIIPFKDKFDKTLKLYSLMTTKPEEVEARKQKEMEE